jgi:hypothetical protein
MEKTIEEVGVGGLVLTATGKTVRLTKIEPNPIIQVVHGKSVIVHYERADDPSLTGEMMLGTLTKVAVPADAAG